MTAEEVAEHTADDCDNEQVGAHHASVATGGSAVLEATHVELSLSGYSGSRARVRDA